MLQVINILIAFCVIFSFTLIILVELNRHSTSVLFWISLFALIGLPHSIELIFNKMSNYSNATYIKASIFMISYNLVYFLLLLNYRYVKINWIPRDKMKDYSLSKLLKLMLCYSLGIIIWLVGLYSIKDNIKEFTWTDMRSVSNIYSMMGNYFLAMGAPVLFLSFIYRKRKLFIISIVLALFVVTILRARIQLVPIFIPFFYYLLYKGNKINIKLKYVIYLFVFVIIIFFTQQFRYLGSIKNIKDASFTTLLTNSFKKMSSGTGEFSVRNAFYKFVEHKNNFEGFGEGKTYKRLILICIPSGIFQKIGLEDLKPRDFAMDMWQAYHNKINVDGGTYHPTFYGDAYANFGWFGIFIAPFWFIIFYILNLIVAKGSLFRQSFLIVPYSVFYIMLARGAIYNASFLLFLMLIFYIILNLKISWKKFVT